MREIKFRGKEMSSGEWVFGYAVKRGSEWWIDNETTDWKSQPPLGVIQYHKHKVIEKSLGEFSGIKSNENNLEMYEGDIVKGNDIAGIGRFIGIVSFASGRFVVDGVKQYNGLRFDLNALFKPIGNVIDNTDLLENQIS